MLNKVLAALRLSSSAPQGLKDEVSDIIGDAKADLARVGVAVPQTDADIKNDAEIVRAIILYAKWQYGYNEQSEKYRVMYEHKVRGMCLDGDRDVVE